MGHVAAVYGFDQVDGLFFHRDHVGLYLALEVTVENVPDYKTQKAVQNLIKDLEVSAVSKRGFGNGELKLSVVFRGNADGFADMVDGKKVMKKKLSVIDIAGSQIKIKLQ